MGITPTRDTAPTVGLIPTQPLREAGQIIEPSVSVPTASETNPPAIAEPEPDEDPPALCLCIQGLAVNPPTADQPLVDLVDLIFAHSDKFVAPIMLAPAARNRVTSSESCLTG